MEETSVITPLKATLQQKLTAKKEPLIKTQLPLKNLARLAVIRALNLPTPVAPPLKAQILDESKNNKWAEVVARETNREFGGFVELLEVGDLLREEVEGEAGGKYLEGKEA